MRRPLAPSELIINADGSVFHLHLKPEQLADKIILVGDPARVDDVAACFDSRQYETANREYRAVTGDYRGKRLTVVSHGIGAGNMDIVLTELDALANVDFASRTVKPQFRRLTLVRIGTAGGLQPFTPVGAYVAAEASIGLDGVAYFYDGNDKVRDNRLETELIRRLPWPSGIRPYAVRADAALTEQIAGDNILRGIALSANGFYGPQGRQVRLPLAAPSLNAQLEDFACDGRRITHYEMESGALAALAALMGHRATTVCCIIAGRIDNRMNTSYRAALAALIPTVLQRI